MKKTDENNDLTEEVVDSPRSEAGETAQVNEDLQKLTDKVGDLENQLKRAVADYRNLEKRVEDGRNQLNSWASTELINKLLPVLDHLEQAVSGASEQDRSSGWFRGVELAVNQFKTVLKEEGLEEIVTEGQFDPKLHEAVDAAPGVDNQILKVAARGYNLNGKVLRPAKVIVGKKGAD